MRNYASFVHQLQEDLNHFLVHPAPSWTDRALRNVDGLASEELRRLVPLASRRAYGAFFTSSEMAAEVLQAFEPGFTKESFVYDPACGAGNLLIAAANYCYKRNIKVDWNTQLLGTDLHPEFVQAARLRLSMHAMVYGRAATLAASKTRAIKVGDGLKTNGFYRKATHIFVNPPFNQVKPFQKSTWSDGKVSAAALFMDHITKAATPGTVIMAILPDVLRSGSRYQKWRSMIEKRCTIERIKLFSQFDDHADVDVYALKLIVYADKSPKPEFGKAKIKSSFPSLSDLCDISVGPVVHYRDEKKGPSRPYIISKGLKGWTTLESTTHARKHPGEPFVGPLVVIKRTSRFGDPHRAIATIIHFDTPVFIDNHLIVLKPKKGGLSACRKVLAILKDTRTTDWLNNAIRCRHLTVPLIKKLPVWPKPENATVSDKS